MVVCVCERRVWLKTQRFGCVNVCEKQTLAKVTTVGLLDVCVCVFVCVLGSWLEPSQCTSSRNRADRILMDFDGKH